MTQLKLIIHIVQIVTGILLIAVILLQAKGDSLGSTTGAGGVLSTRRGAEKGLFIVTIILATLFMSVALAQLFL